MVFISKEEPGLGAGGFMKKMNKWSGRNFSMIYYFNLTIMRWIWIGCDIDKRLKSVQGYCILEMFEHG